MASSVETLSLSGAQRGCAPDFFISDELSEHEAVIAMSDSVLLVAALRSYGEKFSQKYLLTNASSHLRYKKRGHVPPLASSWILSHQAVTVKS